MQENLEGKTIGTLAIIKAVGKRKGSYLCKCLICGREFMDYRSRILAKVTPSCGCSAKAIMSVAAKEGKEEAYAGRLKSKKLFRNNTSGVKGVAWDKSRQKWIVLSGEYVHTIGFFMKMKLTPMNIKKFETTLPL